MARARRHRASSLLPRLRRIGPGCTSGWGRFFARLGPHHSLRANTSPHVNAETAIDTMKAMARTRSCPSGRSVSATALPDSSPRPATLSSPRLPPHPPRSPRRLPSWAPGSRHPRNARHPARPASNGASKEDPTAHSPPQPLLGVSSPPCPSGASRPLGPVPTRPPKGPTQKRAAPLTSPPLEPRQRQRPCRPTGGARSDSGRRRSRRASVVDAPALLANRRGAGWEPGLVGAASRPGPWPRGWPRVDPRASKPPSGPARPGHKTDRQLGPSWLPAGAAAVPAVWRRRHCTLGRARPVLGARVDLSLCRPAQPERSRRPTCPAGPGSGVRGARAGRTLPSQVGIARSALYRPSAARRSAAQTSSRAALRRRRRAAIRERRPLAAAGPTPRQLE